MCKIKFIHLFMFIFCHHLIRSVLCCFSWEVTVAWASFWDESFFYLMHFLKIVFFTWIQKENRKLEAGGWKSSLKLSSICLFQLLKSPYRHLSLAYIYIYICIFAVLQSLCTLRILRPKRSLHAMPMQILVFLWLCKKERKKEIYMHLILYKNKSIENYS